ncbi:unnamed protein product [Linum tenue]|uniref:AraC family transcriptional regulator n=1 Tax=Linum tenue TaxID=586396 RepID=A0AAV0KV21_9ROSI|nr:unnamed protein product [Linum tenue]
MKHQSYSIDHSATKPLHNHLEGETW